MAEEKNQKDKIAITRAPEYRSAYVNQARGGMTNWDIHLTFGRVVEIAPGMPAIEEAFSVVMAPEYAKKMLELLSETIKQFENQFGPITRSPHSGIESGTLDDIKAGIQLTVSDDLVK